MKAFKIVLMIFILLMSLVASAKADLYEVVSFTGGPVNTYMYFNYDQILDQEPEYGYRGMLCMVSFFAQHDGFAHVYAVRAPFAASELAWLNDKNAKDYTNDIIGNKAVFDKALKAQAAKEHRPLSNLLKETFSHQIAEGWDLSFLNNANIKQNQRDQDEMK